MQVWRKGGGFVPLALYAAQLALNLAWSPIFFKKHQLGFALADITGAPMLGLHSWPACRVASFRCHAAKHIIIVAPHLNDCRLLICTISWAALMLLRVQLYIQTQSSEMQQCHAL